MVQQDFFRHYDLCLSDEEAREYILLLCDSYKKKKIENCLYSDSDYIPENIILIYLYYVLKNDYQVMVEDYKRSFILNESLVEPNTSEEEKNGLGKIYDYIKEFDFGKDHFNVFITSLKLHCLLYSECPFPEFGGKLRMDTAFLNEINYEVMAPEEARSIFQSMVSTNIINDDMSIFDYIDECIRLSIYLIKIQPFPDGNKRTFRALLNVMLSKFRIPPIYIALDERDIYKRELYKAICDSDYTGITRFYYYKICDAIMELDINKLGKTHMKLSPLNGHIKKLVRK